MPDGKKRDEAGRSSTRPRRGQRRSNSPIGFRPSQATRAHLDQAADEAGISISAVIESKLSEAFQGEAQMRRRLERDFGGPHAYTLFFLLARVATGVEHKLGAPWIDDLHTWQDVTRAVITMLESLGGRDAVSKDKSNQPDIVTDTTAKHAIGDVPLRPAWRTVPAAVEDILRFDKPLQWPLSDQLIQGAPGSRSNVAPSREELRRLYSSLSALTKQAG